MLPPFTLIIDVKIGMIETKHETIIITIANHQGLCLDSFITVSLEINEENKNFIVFIF